VSELYPDRRAVERFRWALIDATHREALPAHWPTQVVAPGFLGDDTERCPVLLDLHAMRSDERAEWCDALHQETLALQDTRASLLIAAEAPMGAVATHLAQRMVLKLPEHDRPMQWRFFDPGTSLQMPRVLGSDGMAWLMGPVTAFMVPWAGEWTLIERHRAVGSASTTHAFKLDATQLAALSRLGVVNRAAMACPMPEGAQAWTLQGQQLDHYIVQGQQQGLTQRDDLVAYALKAHHVHPRIHEHPRMRALLTLLQKAHPNDELDYRELTAAIAPEDWTAMAAELQTPSFQEETHP